MATNVAAQADALEVILEAITGGTASQGDYGILASAGNYAFVIWPGSGGPERDTMANGWQYVNHFGVEAFSRVSGDAVGAGELSFDIIDAVNAALVADDTLTGTCNAVEAVGYEFQGQIKLGERGPTWRSSMLDIETIKFD